MSKLFIEDTTLTAIGDAIREKTESTDLIAPGDMPSAIRAIESGGNTDIEDGLVATTLAGDYVNNRVTSIGAYAFYTQDKLTSIDMPNVTTIGDYAFYDCAALENVNLPNLKTIANNGFRYCEALREINLPALTSFTSNYCFGGGSASTNAYLDKADFGALTKIGTYTFRYCPLTTLIIRTPSVCTLGGTNAFQSTNIAAGTGYIYVPDDLVDSYKTATNWSTYADQIKPLSELEG